eukprot:3783721-Amphidinium_carterae.3
MADCIHSVIAHGEDRGFKTCDINSENTCALVVQEGIEYELTRLLNEHRVPLAPQRTNVRHEGISARSVLLGAFTTRGTGVTRRCKEPHWAKILSLVHELAKLRGEDRRKVPYCAIQITSTCDGCPLPPHVDGNNEGPTDILVAGNFEGGELHCDGKVVDAIGKWAVFDGNKVHHGDAYRGTRVSIALYKPRGWHELSESVRAELVQHGFPVCESN